MSDACPNCGEIGIRESIGDKQDLHTCTNENCAVDRYWVAG